MIRLLSIGDGDVSPARHLHLQAKTGGNPPFSEEIATTGGRNTGLAMTPKRKARTLELAGMLGEVTEGTLRSAHDILQLVQKTRLENS